MSKYNILYTYSDSVTNDLIVSPSVILTYGDFWNDKYSLPVKRISVGGPFYEMKRVEAINKKPLKEFSNLEKEKTFLIISSMSCGKTLENLVLKIANSLTDYRFIYKLRPSEYSFWKTAYTKEFIDHPNIFVIDNDHNNLYDLFLLSSYQIGVNSTAIVEGITFNLKTFILKDGWYLEMQEFIELGLARLVESPEDVIKSLVLDNLKDKNFSNLFLENSLENIQREINI